MVNDFVGVLLVSTLPQTRTRLAAAPLDCPVAAVACSPFSHPASGPIPTTALPVVKHIHSTGVLTPTPLNHGQKRAPSAHDCTLTASLVDLRLLDRNTAHTRALGAHVVGRGRVTS